MKLHDFQLQTFTKWITFIPTVEVHIDNPVYKEKNIALILNIFIWHFRWLFIKEKENEEYISEALDMAIKSLKQYYPHSEKSENLLQEFYKAIDEGNRDKAELIFNDIQNLLDADDPVLASCEIKLNLLNLPVENDIPHQKMGCEGCIYEKTGDNSTYPCSHCGRCYTDKYKAESEE